MSINYYGLKDPITYLSVDRIPKPNIAGLYMVSIEINHISAGVLIVREEELEETIKLFSDGDSDNTIYHSWWGGEKFGKLTERISRTDKLIVISERGEVVKVKDLEEEVSKTKLKLKEKK